MHYRSGGYMCISHKVVVVRSPIYKGSGPGADRLTASSIFNGSSRGRVERNHTGYVPTLITNLERNTTRFTTAASSHCTTSGA